MPTSDANTIPAILNEVCRLNPRSVLDLGAGCGKYGALCREYLDGAHGRFHRGQWWKRIDAVEGCEKYLSDLHYSVYDNVYIEDFTSHKDKWTGYDLVLMVDSIEHLDRDAGERMLDGLLTNNEHVIVSCPMGVYFQQQDAVWGNEFERHRTNWEPADFTKRGGVCIFSGVCTVFSIPGVVA